jgi:hypothetical protein
MSQGKEEGRKNLSFLKWIARKNRSVGIACNGLALSFSVMALQVEY